MALTLDVWAIPPESARRGRPPGAVPGRAARAADPALHVRRRPRARPVHGQRLDARRGRPPRPPLRRLRPRRRAPRIPRPTCRRRRRATGRRPRQRQSGRRLAAEILGDAGFHDIETKVRIALDGHDRQLRSARCGTTTAGTSTCRVRTPSRPTACSAPRTRGVPSDAHTRAASQRAPTVRSADDPLAAADRGGRGGSAHGRAEAVFDAIELRSPAGLERLADAWRAHGAAAGRLLGRPGHRRARLTGARPAHHDHRGRHGFGDVRRAGCGNCIADAHVRGRRTCRRSCGVRSATRGMGGTHSDAFHYVWCNGTEFWRARDGLRGRRPRT